MILDSAHIAQQSEDRSHDVFIGNLDYEIISRDNHLLYLLLLRQNTNEIITQVFILIMRMNCQFFVESSVWWVSNYHVSKWYSGQSYSSRTSARQKHNYAWYEFV